MLNRNDLLELQKLRGEALISIIAPMERTFPASDKNPIILKNLIRETEERLKSNYDPLRVSALMEKVEALQNEIDFQNTGEGIALFVSEEASRLVQLPFTPREMVSIGNTFHTRDLFYGLRRHPQYLLLSLSAGQVHLLRGSGTLLREIKNEFFPAHYGGPARSEAQSNLRRTDEESEELEDIRIFLRSVDEALYNIVKNDKTPLVLCGEAEYISFIKNQNSGKNVVGEVQGNFAHSSWKDLGEKVYPEVERYILEQKAALMANLQEMVGYNRYAGGVQDVWKATQLGQVMTLLVEQNYNEKAHVMTSDPLTLQLGEQVPPGVANTHDDIVDEIIEQATAMDGEVVFVEDGALEKHGRVAAILRYAV